MVSFGIYAQNTETVIIFHTNDMHGNLKNFPVAKYIIDSVKTIYGETVFVFSAGDIFTGNPVVDKFIPDTVKKKTNKYFGYPIIDIMNKIGYDVSEIGNHEFDYTIPVFIEREKQAEFSFICANIKPNDTGVKLHPYKMFKTKAGNKIFVLGLLQIGKNGYPDAYIPKVKALTFLNPNEVISQYSGVRDTVNLFILLSHLGSDTDMVVASRTDIFDLIIGGHTHKLIDTVINNTLVVQAYKKMRYLGMITVEIKDGKVVRKKEKFFNLREYGSYDNELKKLVDKYENAEFLNEVVAVAKETLYELDRLGKLITNAMLDYTKADIAFQNNGGIRLREIPKGDITLRTVYSLSPFGNKYVLLKMNVNQIVDLIKYAYSLHNENELQAGGISFELVKDKNGALKSVTLYKEGKPIKKGTFTVAINDYMYSAYEIKYEEKIKIFEKPDAEVIISYLKKQKVIQ